MADDRRPSLEIRFRGRLDRRLRRRARRLALRGVLPGEWILVLVAAALLLGAALFVRGYALPGAVFVSLGLLGLLVLALYALAAARGAGAEETEEPFEGALGEGGFEATGPHGTIRIPWDRFRGWKGSRSMLLLYESARSFHALAAEHFSTPDEWRSARALVARKIPTTQGDERRRLVRIFFFWFALFLALTLLWALTR